MYAFLIIPLILFKLNQLKHLKRSLVSPSFVLSSISHTRYRLPTVEMKFIPTVLVLAATAVALPQHGGDGNIFPVSNGMTVEQAQAKCGNDATVSCCNKTTYSKDITTSNNGPLAGVLQSALGGGPGGNGLGLFGQCNDLSLNSVSLSLPVLNVVGGGIDQLINQKCKQNIACCQNTESNANGDLIGVAIPCVALGSLI
ncbi:conidial hydrophobin Hyp1/RodA [Penicillium verhagenii]|nr:conidial hydrophobin Hyp1/RodA [Penicillium verhagenii]